MSNVAIAPSLMLDVQKMKESQAVKIGIISAALSIFPAASLVALVYRFPIPFGGYLSGIEGAFMSIPAVLFYLVIGGVVVVLISGLSSGLAFYRMGAPDDKMKKGIIASTSIISLAAATLLANLEKIIGPW